MYHYYQLLVLLWRDSFSISVRFLGFTHGYWSGCGFILPYRIMLSDKRRCNKTFCWTTLMAACGEQRQHWINNTVFTNRASLVYNGCEIYKIDSGDKLPLLVKTSQAYVSHSLWHPSPTPRLLAVELFQLIGEGAKADRWCLKTSCFVEMGFVNIRW
jgi:hypothetical protein